LSHRERQVAALVARGLSNKQIAFELHLSEGTIKVYIFHIFQKARVTNRTELAVWQIQQGELSCAPQTRAERESLTGLFDGLGL
jgi:two-component system, NarL family, nitrate/nitrite response regulator NarL